MGEYYKINYEIFPDYIIKILKYRQYVENLSESTVYSDAQRIKIFLRYLICIHNKISLKCNKTIIDCSIVKLSWFKHVTLKDMLNYIEFLRTGLFLSPQCLFNTVLTVKTFYRYLYKFEYLNKLMFDDLSLPKYREKTVVYMSIEDCKKLFFSIDNIRDKAIIYLLLNTGARRSEVANALINNLDLKNRTLLVVGKGNKERFLYLNDLTCKVLEEYLKTRKASNHYLFVTKHNNKMANEDIYRVVKKYIDKSGLDSKKYSTHKLRHTFATLLYQKRY